MTDEQAPNVAEILSQNIETKKQEWINTGYKLFEEIGSIEEGEEIYAYLDKFKAGQINEEELRERVREYNPETELVDYYLKELSLKRELENLKSEHLPFKLAELQTQVESLSSRINYDAIIEYYDELYKGEREYDRWDNGEMANATASLAILRRTAIQIKSGKIKNKTWDDITQIEEVIHGSSTEWEKRGFLHEQPQNMHEESIETTREHRLELKEQLQNGLTVLVEYGRLRNRYWALSHDYIFVDKMLSKITESLDLEKGFDYEKDSWLENEYDPRYLDAVEEFVAKRKQQYINDGKLPASGEAYVEHMTKLKAMEPQEMVDQITLIGFEPHEDEILVVSEQKFKEQLALLVPACFLDKIEIVTSKKKPNVIDKSNPNIETAGSHTPEIDENGNLIKSKIEIYRSPRANENATQKEQEVVEAAFMETALHEIAHRIHHELSYGDMQAWQKVVNTDRANPTWYVPYIRDRYGHLRANREDFTESFQMALLNPGALMEVSQARFDYMMKLVGMYMGNSQYEAFAHDIDEKLKKHEADKAMFITAYSEAIAKEANKK